MTKLVIANKNITVDDCDYFDVVTKYGVCVKTNPDGYTYPICTLGKYANKSLARVLVNCPKGYTVDHIDGDTLNNTRSNLRVATSQQNSFNRKGRSNGLPKGVKYRKDTQMYEARIIVSYTYYHLGTFDTAEEAGEAYKTAADKFHRNFAEHKR